MTDQQKKRVWNNIIEVMEGEAITLRAHAQEFREQPDVGLLLYIVSGTIRKLGQVIARSRYLIEDKESGE